MAANDFRTHPSLFAGLAYFFTLFILSVWISYLVPTHRHAQINKGEDKTAPQFNQQKLYSVVHS